MAKMIQVRNVSDRLHRELTRRAGQSGLTLTEFIERILEREVAQPPVSDLVDRVIAREPVQLGLSAAELVRASRTERGA